MNKFTRWKVRENDQLSFLSSLILLESFSDSESISRKNLAQSILAKERESEFKKGLQVRFIPRLFVHFFSSLKLIEMKLEYSEQALEQERAISNESKLNVQLLTHRLADLEETCQTFKGKSSNQERKIDELERQCSNEKLLRSTLAKLQSEIETKCSETQKLIIDYEKQLKHNRDELANVNIQIEH